MSRAADLRRQLYGERSEAILAAAPEPEPEPETESEPETAAKRKPGRPKKGTT